MKASDLFVRCVEEEGIEYIFGVPREENADFMRSLEGLDKIKFILTRHEQGAADGSSRTKSGRREYTHLTLLHSAPALLVQTRQAFRMRGKRSRSTRIVLLDYA